MLSQTLHGNALDNCPKMGTSVDQLSDRGIGSGAADDACHFAWNVEEDGASEKGRDPRIGFGERNIAAGQY